MSLSTTLNTLPNIMTEIDVQKILKNNNLFCGYKSIDSRLLDITTNGLKLLTKKKFVSKKQVVNQLEFDLFLKKHNKYVDFFHDNDNITLYKNSWLGIEPCYFEQKLLFALTHKKVVFDRNNTITGIFCYCYHFFDATIIKSLEENLLSNFHNNFSFEFIENNNDDIQLDPLEANCLFHIIRGKSTKEISMLLNLSFYITQKYIKSLIFKFKCEEKSQLVEKAISLGYGQKIPTSYIGLPTSISSNFEK